MSAPDGDKNQITKTIAFPVDLTPKVALVKPSESKTTVQTQQTFRTIGQQQMRVVMPAGTVQTSGTAQIIQTHLMPQAMLKQVDTSGRTQITTLPAKSLAQTSITVTRPPTPTTYVQRGVTTVTNMPGPRGVVSNPIRTPTPPATVTNISSSFVRGSIPPRTPSPAATVISPGATTWMSGGAVQVQVPAQLIRASISQSPRPQRIVTQNTASIASTNNNVTVANVVAAQQQHQQQQQHSQQNQVTGQQQGQQIFATLAAVQCPPRPQTATLVYTNVSNPQQQFSGPTQRLAIATSLGGPRQVRPIQLSNARLPATGIRVSAANISIRTPSVPVLAPTSVLTSIPSSVQGRGNAGSVSSTNLSTNNLPATRIIQVQQQQPGTTTQVINAGRISGNLMTLHPVIMNTASGSNRTPTTITAKVQPSLTITHVSKITTPTGNPTSVSVATSNNNLSQGTPITGLNVSQLHHPHSHHSTGQLQATNVATVSQAQMQQQQQQQQAQSIAQIVSVNQQGITSQGHQIVTLNQQQLINAQNQQNSGTTVVPLAITTRASNVLTGTITSAANINHQTTTGIVRTNMAGVTGNVATATMLPIAKVLPQQQQGVTGEGQQQNITSTHQIQTPNSGSVFIHTRSPNTGIPGGTTTVIPSSGTTFLPTTGFFYEHAVSTTGGNPVLTLTTSSVSSSNTPTTISNTNVATGLVPSVPYTPTAGSFAVVPATNRAIGQIHGIIPTTSGPQQQTNQIQAVPVRFNPQLIVDSNQAHPGTTHQIITMTQAGTPTVQGTIPGQHHMLIPVPAKIQTSPRPSILRKRDNEGSPMKAVKNLVPTLLAMGPAPSTALEIVDKCRERDNMSPPSRPPSSDGSTTVSATSSPGLEEQEREELKLNMRIQKEISFKKTVEEIYRTGVTGPSSVVIGMSAASVISGTIGGPSSTSNANTAISSIGSHMIQHQNSTGSSTNGNSDLVSPRKKPRKQQLNNDNSSLSSMHYSNEDVIFGTEGTNKVNSTSINNNKENAHPPEITIKKPRACSLLESYKQNWKAANNHFQRYSDVKPREERRPTVMDLANQAHVLQKVNGWKIYHLSAQMEDLCEMESQVYDKLSTMLQLMEAHEQSSDVDRVNDLLKGNMQRSKVIIDGVNEARSQIMKIFDHKAHVSDIIHRCASKRNFKKREKT